MMGFNKQDAILAFNLLKMNVRDRYLGSALGGLWAIANPLFMLSLYTFVFGFVFKVRLPGADTTLAYVVWLISGYGPWIATTEAIVASANSVVGSSGIVKNMAFKVELLPISAAFIGLISLSVSFVFLLILMICADNLPTWHLIWLPLVIGIHFLFVISIGIWLSAVMVFIRDLAQALPNLLTIILFLTPIFYSMDSMPAVIRNITFINPFYQISDAYRNVLILHIQPSFNGLVYVFLLSSVVFYFGLRVFRKVKGFFDSAL